MTSSLWADIIQKLIKNTAKFWKKNSKTKPLDNSKIILKPESKLVFYNPFG